MGVACGLPVRIWSPQWLHVRSWSPAVPSLQTSRRDVGRTSSLESDLAQSITPGTDSDEGPSELEDRPESADGMGEIVAEEAAEEGAELGVAGGTRTGRLASGDQSGPEDCADGQRYLGISHHVIYDVIPKRLRRNRTERC